MKTCEWCCQLFALDFRNYDHVHPVRALPAPRNVENDDEDHIVVHGYAVQISGGMPQCVLFFHDREPALAFGLAGRMSLDVSDYGVYHAAREVRDDRRSAVTTLYVDLARKIDRLPDEHDDLARWLAGVSARSSHFQPATDTLT